MATHTFEPQGTPEPIGATVAVWKSLRQQNQRGDRLYINRTPDGVDPHTQRVTAYGIRGDGQGEDNTTHVYVGPGTVTEHIMGTTYGQHGEEETYVRAIVVDVPVEMHL